MAEPLEKAIVHAVRAVLDEHHFPYNWSERSERALDHELEQAVAQVLKYYKNVEMTEYVNAHAQIYQKEER